MTAAVLATFLAFVFLPAVLAHPFVHAATGRRQGIWPLSLVTGLSAFLVVFSLLAREIPGYFLTMPLALGLLAAASYFGTRALAARARVLDAFRPGREGVVLALFALVLFAGLLFLRTQFSSTYFDAGRFGAEKLYNVQFIQAFLFAENYPPESPWFAGAPVGYYILPKAVPGLALHILHHAFGVRGSAGILFHISDVFFISLGLVTLAATIFAFLPGANTSTSPRRGSSVAPLALSLGLACVPLLGAPARALAQAYAGTVDLWSLTRIVENTINEYPFWNFLWADNHSHSSAIFLQLGFLFWFLWFLRSQAGHVRLAAGACAALLATALVLSHSGSVFIALFVCAAFALFTAIRTAKSGGRQGLLLLSRDAAFIIAVACVLALPDLATRGQPGVKWYLVPDKYGTSLSDFFNIYLPHMLVVAGACALTLPRFNRAQATELVLSCFGVIILTVIGRPSWGLAFLTFNLLRLTSAAAQKRLDDRAHDRHEDHDGRRAPLHGDYALASGAAAALFLLLFAPEFVASNFDMGEQYMRYNTLFRFLFESYYLVPLLTALALGPVLLASLRVRAVALTAAAVSIAAAGVFTWAQVAAARTRIAAVPAAGNLDGLAWFAREHPGDAALVSFLTDVPSNAVRIIEECAMAPKPSAYTLLSRMASLSGRPALCGWGNHVLLFQKGVPHLDYRGQGTWDLLLERERWTQAIYALADLDAATQKGLRDFGITHVVFGEQEKEKHPTLTLAALSKYGRVVFNSGEFGVVELAKAIP